DIGGAGPKRRSRHQLCIAAPDPIDRKENCGECQNGQGNQDVQESSPGLEVEYCKEGENCNERQNDPIRDQELAKIRNDRVAHAEYKEDLKPEQSHSRPNSTRKPWPIESKPDIDEANVQRRDSRGARSNTGCRDCVPYQHRRRLLGGFLWIVLA